MLYLLQLAVMPTITVGGPLALLALLFPATCGGLIFLMRRWRVVFLVVSVTSTLHLVHGWFYSYVFDSWWESLLELWFCIALVLFVGLMQTRSAVPGKDDAASRRRDLFSLSSVLTLCVLSLAYIWLFRGAWLAGYARAIAVSAFACLAGVIHVLRRRPLREVHGNREWDSPAVVLAGGLIACTVVLVQCGMRVWQADSVTLRWTFAPDVEGSMYSSPVIDGDRIFQGISLHQSPPAASGGLFCLNRHSGELLWKFDDENQMKSVLSSPCVENGRVYIGEGFHSDTPCKLYCVSVETGRKLWDFEVPSHTESTPNVVAGRVYFGAGDDGLYCLDAKSGKPIWHFEGPHVDARPTVVNNCVYAGSGYGVLEVFCLDAHTGRPVWRTPVEVSSFGAATVAEDAVFFGIGNGVFLASSENPEGALLCLDSRSGKVNWRIDTGDAVHAHPVVYKNRVLFASRDHFCYCAEIKTGKLLWKKDLGSPIVASPVLDANAGGDTGPVVYVLTSDGALACLNPISGVTFSTAWLGDYAQIRPGIMSTPAVIPFGGTLQSPGRIYLAGTIHQIQLRPTLFCFE